MDQTEEEVLGPDVVVVEQARLFLREDNDTTCPVREAFEHGIKGTTIRLDAPSRDGSGRHEDRCTDGGSAALRPMFDAASYEVGRRYGPAAVVRGFQWSPPAVLDQMGPLFPSVPTDRGRVRGAEGECRSLHDPSGWSCDARGLRCRWS